MWRPLRVEERLMRMQRDRFRLMRDGCVLMVEESNAAGQRLFAPVNRQRAVREGVTLYLPASSGEPSEPVLFGEASVEFRHMREDGSLEKRPEPRRSKGTDSFQKLHKGRRAQRLRKFSRCIMSLREDIHAEHPSEIRAVRFLDVIEINGLVHPRITHTDANDTSYRQTGT